jgi:hypothetical protein
LIAHGSEGKQKQFLLDGPALGGGALESETWCRKLVALRNMVAKETSSANDECSHAISYGSPRLQIRRSSMDIDAPSFTASPDSTELEATGSAFSRMG